MWVCHISTVCRDTSCRIAGKSTCEKWACLLCLCDTLLAPIAQDDETTMQLLRKKKRKRSGLDRSRLQGEICLSEQVAYTQRCLLPLYITEKKKRQKNNSWQFDKWVGCDIYGTCLIGSCREAHEWNQNWLLPVLCHSMHFKRILC